MNDLKNTVTRLLSLPVEPEARAASLAVLRERTAVALNVVLLLAVLGVLALSGGNVLHYLLCSAILASWFLLAQLRAK